MGLYVREGSGGVGELGCMNRKGVGVVGVVCKVKGVGLGEWGCM